MLLARLFQSSPLTCPYCGAEMRIVAFITKAGALLSRVLNPEHFTECYPNLLLATSTSLRCLISNPFVAVLYYAMPPQLAH